MFKSSYCGHIFFLEDFTYNLENTYNFKETFRACADIKINPELGSAFQTDIKKGLDNDLDNNLGDDLDNDLGYDLDNDLDNFQQNPVEPRFKKLTKSP